MLWYAESNETVLSGATQGQAQVEETQVFYTAVERNFLCMVITIYPYEDPLFTVYKIEQWETEFCAGFAVNVFFSDSPWVEI